MCSRLVWERLRQASLVLAAEELAALAMSPIARQRLLRCVPGFDAAADDGAAGAGCGGRESARYEESPVFFGSKLLQREKDEDVFQAVEARSRLHVNNLKRQRLPGVGDSADEQSLGENAVVAGG